MKDLSKVTWLQVVVLGSKTPGAMFFRAPYHSSSGSSPDNHSGHCVTFQLNWFDKHWPCLIRGMISLFG